MNIRSIWLHLCLGVLVSTGCATTSLPPVELVDVSTLSKAAPDDAAGVYLRDYRRWLIVSPPSGHAYSEQQVHRVFKVLTESAFTVGSTHIELPKGAVLKDLRARTITKTGEVIPVDVSSILSSTYQTSSDDGGSTRSFQFPRVEVGSIIEYTSTVVYDDPMWWLVDDIAGAYPVEDYQLEIHTDRFTKPDLLVNNAQPPLRYDIAKDGTQILGFSLQHVLPTPRAPFRPHDRELTPWWVYRAVEWRYPKRVQPGVSTWARAVGVLHKRLVEGKDMGAFTIRGHEACHGDTLCVARAALTTLREDVVLSGFNIGLQTRPLAEVKASKTATNQELALALWQLLQSGGVEAFVAPTSRAAFVAPLETFPSAAWLNHMVVFVPMASGGVWIDPSCESCDVGVVPSWSNNSRAFTVFKGSGEYGEELRSSAFVTITGQAAPVGHDDTSAVVTVETTGDVEVSVTRTTTQDRAVDVMITADDQSDDGIRKSLLDDIDDISESAELVRFARPVCDRRGARCEQRFTYRVPGYATVMEKGARLVVPVPELRAGFDNLQRSTAKQRTVPIAFWTPQTVREEVQLQLPQGYTVDLTGHEPGRQSYGGLAVTLEASVVDQRVTIARHYDVTPGRWPAAELEGFHTALKGARIFKRNALNLNRIAPATTPAAAVPAASAPAPAAPAPAPAR